MVDFPASHVGFRGGGGVNLFSWLSWIKTDQWFTKLNNAFSCRSCWKKHGPNWTSKKIHQSPFLFYFFFFFFFFFFFSSSSISPLHNWSLVFMSLLYLILYRYTYYTNIVFQFIKNYIGPFKISKLCSILHYHNFSESHQESGLIFGFHGTGRLLRWAFRDMNHKILIGSGSGVLTLQESNISHLVKKKIIFKSAGWEGIC